MDFSNFIERYNSGEMSEAERQWFLMEMETNEELLNEVILRKNTDQILKNQNMLGLRNRLSEIENRRESDLFVIDSKKPHYTRYAAVIAALILIGSAVLYTGRNPGREKILTRYYKTYEAPGNQRTGQSEGNADFTMALGFYNSRDYEDAAIYFNKVLETNPDDMESVFLKGVSNFENGIYPQAKQSFAKVIDDNNSLFSETAKWYLALSFIGNNEPDKAISQLQMIAGEGGLYSSDARKIIRKLNR